MDEPTSEQSPFVELRCGCMIDDSSGYLHQECIPHRQGNFIQ